MSKERIRFQSAGDFGFLGGKPGLWFQCSEEKARKLDGVICEIRTTHWSWWEIWKGKRMAKRLSKIMRIDN